MDEVVNKWEKPFHIERGDVYMADLGPEYAADKGIQAGYRPLVVTQSDWQNKKSTSVIVAPGTSEMKKTEMRTHVILPMIKGLPKQTMILGEQRFTIASDDLDRYCCTLPPDIMKKITRAIRFAERGNKIKNRKKKK